MARTRRPNLTLGLILLVVGVILLVTRFVAVETAPVWLLGLGAAFALIAIVNASYGALVSGMVLLGLGAGMILGDRGTAGIPEGTWILLGLGAGFVGIYVLALILKLNRHWWPLLPGVVLLVAGGWRYVRRFAFLPPEVVIAIRTWWPAALIVAGGWMLFRALRK